jgi:hypothetical protein
MTYPYTVAAIWQVLRNTAAVQDARDGALEVNRVEIDRDDRRDSCQRFVDVVAVHAPSLQSIFAVEIGPNVSLAEAYTLN